ncbi:hypothetical protein PRIEUP_LOCUS14666 [Pristimantis euphronides]
MDPEVWKMAATNFKIMNRQKGIFAPKMIQVNRGKYLSTERLVKKPTNIVLSEEAVKVEDKTVHPNVKVNCANGVKAGEQGEMIKVCVRQKQTIYKHSVDKWTDVMSNSKDYRKSLALTSSGMRSQNVTKLPFEVENKRLPILVREVGHTFIPQRQERSSVPFRQDGRINDGEVKTLVSNHCSKSKSTWTNVKKEPLYQSVADVRCQDGGLQRGIPFNYSSKRVILKNNAAHHSGPSDTCKRIKISNDVTSMYGVGRISQKVFDHRQLPRRQMPAASGALTNAGSVTYKTTTNRMTKVARRSSSPDEVKGGKANFKEKDKTDGGSTHRRFLLIDSQGLPYTVFIKEPISGGLNGSASTSASDSTLAKVSKSVTPRKVYKCPICFRIFEYLSYLQRHSIAHSQQKPHICKVCGKAFKRTSHLTRHKYTHFGGKPCHCQICHRRFRDVGELSRHQQSHIGDKNH